MPDQNHSRGLVLVTGGSGYIAAFCIAELLAEGWRVRATIRDIGKSRSVGASLAAITPEAASVEFVAADLNADAGWGSAVAGADYVLHVASPVPATRPKNDDEVVRPARDGTLRVLKASRDARVKRVVITSSAASIFYGRPPRPTPFTEDDWTDETNLRDTSAYERSKTIAERAAWAWLKTEGGALELTAVNPVLVVGPLFGTDFSASILAIKKLLDGSLPALPRFGFGLVDVRDVARLHVLAMTSPNAANQRFIASADYLWMKDIAAILRAEWGAKGKKIPSFLIPDVVVKLLALFDPAIRSRLFELGHMRVGSSDRARRVLGWTTRPVRDSILESARSLETYGLA